MENSEMDPRSGLVGFLAGAFVGGVLGLLYAPRSGEETRELIRSKKDQLVDSASKDLEAVRSSAEEKVKALKERVSDMAEKDEITEELQFAKLKQLEKKIDELEKEVATRKK